MANRIDVVTANQNLAKIMKATKQEYSNYTDKRLLALDPGGTTGMAQWDGSGKIALTQLDTDDVPKGFDVIQAELIKFKPEHVRYEDYKVYAWKTADHSFASLHTPQLIGAIRVIGHLHNIPMSCKMAQQAKAFWTDDKLKLCGLYSPGLNLSLIHI